MAGQSHFLTQLRALLAGIDDAALVALASAGLLRRARKDLESLSPTVTEAAEAVEVSIGAQRVTFDASGPARARCTCRATTTCQHVLAAWLHLRGFAIGASASTAVAATSGPAASASTDGVRDAPAPAEVDAAAALLAMPVEALIAFAGLPAVREAADEAADGEPPEIALGKLVTIRLAHPPVELRYAGGGLDAFLLDYRGKRRARLIVQAVLAFQKAHGAAPPALPAKRARRAAQAAADAPAGPAPRLLLERVIATLGDCVRVGVLHLSENMGERLLAHAAAAEGASLHRLSLALSRLANHVDLQLGLSAGSSSTALLDELARAHALAAAIAGSAQRVPPLWGEARSEYDDVARLELVGVAAEPWRTASGYAGLTLLLWSAAQRRWLTATDSRPVATPGFDPVKRYRAAGPWAGCDSPAAACGASVVLGNARVNRMGRLSLAEGTQAHVAPLAEWPDFGDREFSSWSALRGAVQADTAAIGLAEPDAQAGLVVIAPEKWLDAHFDAASQTLTRDVVDASGDRLALRLAYSALADHAMQRLEHVRAKRGVKVLGRAERFRSHVTLKPIALLESAPTRADNLWLDDAPRGSLADALLGGLHGLLKRGDAAQAPSAPLGLTATDTRLRALDTELLAVAERGLPAGQDAGAELARLEESLRGAGLDLLPAGGASPERVLRLRYCVRVLEQLRG